MKKAHKTDVLCALLFLERGTGIEPASEAWEAPIIADILTPLKIVKLL